MNENQENTQEGGMRNRESNRWVWEFIAAIAISTASVLGTQAYCSDPEFRETTNDVVYKVLYVLGGGIG